jgi:hypothetical protein
MYFEHANITVTSIDKAIAFLGAAFPEFAVRGQGETDNTRWLHFGNQQTYIALQQNHQISPTQDIQYKNNGINHLGFVVKDLDTICNALDAKGYEKIENSTKETFRERAYYYDDNQVEWEFIQYFSDNDAQRNQY